MNKMFSEDWAVIGTIDPQTLADSEVFSDVIDMSKFEKVAAIFMTGNMNGSTGSLVARVVTCDSAGSNVAALKTAATIAAAADASDNAQVVIEVDNMDLAEGGTNKDRYVKFGAISGSTGGPVAAVVLGKAFNCPSHALDLASVAEIEIDKD